MPVEQQQAVTINGRETHPAYGVIEVTRPSSSPGRYLFDSEIPHQHYITVRIKEAVKERSLHNTWVYPQETLCEFSMSESQWGKFVSGAGRYVATPVTIDSSASGPLDQKPHIEPPEKTTADVFNDEMKSKLDRTLKTLTETVKKLGELCEGKSLKKSEVKEIQRSLSITLGNLPLDMNYATERFQEATESFVENAKAEIEAYLLNASLHQSSQLSYQEENNPPLPPQIG